MGATKVIIPKLKPIPKISFSKFVFFSTKREGALSLKINLYIFPDKISAFAFFKLIGLISSPDKYINNNKCFLDQFHSFKKMFSS